MASDLAAWRPEVEAPPGVAAIVRPAWVRMAERVAPVGARLLGGRHFRAGVEHGLCGKVHGAAARGILWAFAPPPVFARVRRGCGRHPVDSYRGRVPHLNGLPGGGDTLLHHHRGAGAARGLVVVSRGVGALADLVARRLAAALVRIGFDVAVVSSAGRGPGDDRLWAQSIGRVLVTIVRRVHAGVAAEAWARQLGYRRVLAAGVGLGGTVTALLGATTARFDACVPILAGAHPGRLWLPPRGFARAADHAALARDAVRDARTLLRLFDPVAPCRLPPPRRRGGCAVVGLRYDRQVPPSDVQALAAHWRAGAVWLERSHIEVPLAVRALAAVVAHAAGVRV